MIADILKGLYTGSTSEIYSILNQSIYITDIPNKEDTLLFHTGFGFKSHKGKMFYIYYDLKSALVIRTPDSSNPLYGKIPQLIGLICPLNGDGYIQEFGLKLFTSLILSKSDEEIDENLELIGLRGIDSITMGEISEQSSIQLQNRAVNLVSSDGEEHFVHEKFEIISEKQMINTLPLFKTFIEIVFINSRSLEKYDLEKYKKETQREWQSDEDWYRAEFGDAANDAWWNSH